MISGKNPSQTYAEMIDSTSNKRNTSKLYKAQSLEVSDDRISETVDKVGCELSAIATSGKRVSLNDTETVKAQSILYVKACTQTASCPSMSGWARCMGMSRHAIYDFIRRHPDHPTSEWAMICHDAFSDILAESALRNNCNSIVSIFLQKAMYGMNDNPATMPVIITDQSDELTAEEIARKYSDIPDE